MSSPANPGMPRHTPGPFELLWRWLNSLPIAIVVMVLLAAMSAVGTIVPQVHLDAQPGVPFHETLVARFGSKAQVIEFLGLHDIYKTWYFNALLTWLCVSAVICNIVRYQRTVDLYRNPPVRRGRAFFSADRRTLSTAAAPSDAGEQLTSALKGRGYRLRTDDSGGALCIYADKGFTRKWALVLLHVAVLVLLFGGMYGKAVGVEGMVRMADGEKTTLTLDMLKGKRAFLQPWLRTLEPLVYELDQKTFRVDYYRKILLPTGLQQLPPELQEYYLYDVDDYVSDLSATRNGRTVAREVRVNHPLTIDKLKLYQSGYEQQGYLKASWDGRTDELPMPPSGELYVFTHQGLMPRQMAAGMPMSTQAFDFEAVKSGDLYEGPEKVGRIGPLTLVGIHDSTTGAYMGSQLVTADKALVTTLGGEMVTAVMAQRVDNFSVFSYQRDPGAWILLTGWLTLVLGIALTLYIPFTQVWARIDGSRLWVLPAGPDGREGSPLRRRLDVMLSAGAEADG